MPRGKRRSRTKCYARLPTKRRASAVLPTSASLGRSSRAPRLPSGARRRAGLGSPRVCHTRERSVALGRVRAQGGEEESATKGGGGGLFGWMKKLPKLELPSLDAPYADDKPAPPEVDFMCSTAWTVQLSLYERSPTTPLMKKEAAKLPRVDLGFTLSFEQADAGYFPLRGGVTVDDSRYFLAGQRAYWIYDQPGFFKFTLNVGDVRVGDTLVVPEGRVYFNAKVQEDALQGMRFCMGDGVATVKQDVKASFMGADYTGILAEYIIVGTFSAQPVAASAGQ